MYLTTACGVNKHVSVSSARACVDLPVWRCATTRTSEYQGNPVAGSTSCAMSAAIRCHGMYSSPIFAETAATRPPVVSRAGLRSVQ